MNIMIVSDSQAGADRCDQTWKHLILDSLDPFAADVKNRIFFCCLAGSPKPAAQTKHNLENNQDLSAIELVEFTAETKARKLNALFNEHVFDEVYENETMIPKTCFHELVS